MDFNSTELLQKIKRPALYEIAYSGINDESELKDFMVHRMTVGATQESDQKIAALRQSIKEGNEATLKTAVFMGAALTLLAAASLSALALPALVAFGGSTLFAGGIGLTSVQNHKAEKKGMLPELEKEILLSELSSEFKDQKSMIELKLQAVKDLQIDNKEDFILDAMADYTIRGGAPLGDIVDSKIDKLYADEQRGLMRSVLSKTPEEHAEMDAVRGSTVQKSLNNSSGADLSGLHQLRSDNKPARVKNQMEIDLDYPGINARG